ncbi:DUF1611 domain-containing protein [Membranihabitans maritimus]|uniref:DUF1611 domain-containing protein n=1 Tax=Membranihabitans maritimus TaxID=2904244 RepID=UPI001F2FC415|nr:DUF1611 domain-containing protein [Membranihabitans maritimus]
MIENAVLLTCGLFNHPNAKTAHGLIRVSQKYNIIGVIDNVYSGQDAGELLDGEYRNIPVFPSVVDTVEKFGGGIKYAIVGIALPGGIISEVLKKEIIECIKSGMSIVSGLHDYLSEIPELKSLAKYYDVSLIDVRKPKPKDELTFWSGDIFEVTCPIIGVLGTDCALGKRTTTSLIVNALHEKDVKAEMIYTGQTGYLQGYKYGFILDTTVNDFVSGELEKAILSCYRDCNPEIIFIEGQSALCNPSGPCGAEYLLSARAKGVVLQHAPAREHYKGQDHTKQKISLKREIALIRTYGSEVIVITLNTKGLTREEALDHKINIEKEFEIPVELPIEDGVTGVIDRITDYTSNYNG